MPTKAKHTPGSRIACGDTDETAEANARLIAAAPELLEALANLTAWTTEQLTHFRPAADWDNDARIKAARAAIAKAKGH